MNAATTNAAPVSVGVPTWARGERILQTIDRIQACVPPPAEVIVHVDGCDSQIADRIRTEFPNVVMLSSPARIGPGGGRDKCITAATQPFFVSFDDDSYPVDADFFAKVVELFTANPSAAVLGALIWHRDERELQRKSSLVEKPGFTGCGYALRISAYREIRGFLPRSVPYAIEEPDAAIQLFAQDWKIFESSELRVFHDTDLSHHEDRHLTAETIANVGLFGFLHYPLAAWPWAILQVGNIIAYSIRVGRIRGIIAGLLRIPRTCYQFRYARNPLPLPVLIRFLRYRRSS